MNNQIREYIVQVDDHDERWGYVVQQYTHFFGYSITEEVVRCRDCVYAHTVKNFLGMKGYECWLHADSESGALGKVDTEPFGFCAWGERRE